MKSCKTCLYWQAGSQKKAARKYGHCRRHPPVVMGKETDTAVWPKTYDDSWCGEYQAEDKGSKHAKER